MRSVRNIAFVVLSMTCWAITNGAFLSASGQCDVGISYCAWSSSGAAGAGQMAQEGCASTECLFQCYNSNCVQQNGGPACANACGSGSMPKAEGSCSTNSYGYTSGGNDWYCSNGLCTGCGDPLPE